MIRAVFKSRLPRAMAVLQPSVVDAVRERAEVIADEARNRAPFESGDLRDSIHVEPIEGGASVIAGDADVYYAHMLEFGTTHSAPQPFLIPAYEAQRADLLQAVEDALEDI